MKHARLANCLPHREDLWGVDPDRFFADYMLLAHCTLHDGLEMECIGRQHQHQVDLGMLDDFLPLVGDERSPVHAGRLFEPILPTGTQCDDACHVARLPNFLSVRRSDVTGCPEDSYAYLHLQ